MNITAKKLILIITALLAGIAFMPSCSKEPGATKKAKAEKAKQQAVEKGAKKAAKASMAAEATSTFSDGKNSLSAARNGQYVNLTWHIDPTNDKIQKLDILRSPTGTGQRTMVAELDAQASGHKDCLPDANAYWFWIKAFTADNKFQIFGPVKVDADKADASRYINLADKYKASVTRTLELATLTWDFPEGEYKAINIFRSKHPVALVIGSTGTRVLTTLAVKSQSTNPLPNDNSEYWYSFQIILKSGAVVYKGPIKADYANASAKSPKQK